MNRMIAGSAVAWSARGRHAILQQLRDNARTGARPIGMPPVAALADAVVHGLDVRRPLGLPGQVPSESVDPVADFSLGTPWPMNVVVGGSARRRVSGVRLVATDLDWTHGVGPEVRRLRRGTAASPLRSRPEGGRAGRARRRHGAGPPLTCSPAVAVVKTAWADDARHTTAIGAEPRSEKASGRTDRVHATR